MLKSMCNILCFVLIFKRNKKSERITQLIKRLTIESEDLLSSFLGTNMVEGKNQLLQIDFLRLTHALWHVIPPPHINTH